MLWLTDIAVFLVVLSLAASAWAVVWWMPKTIRKRMPNASTGKALALYAFMLVSIIFGSTKSPVQRHFADFVTALRDGTILDPSGRVSATAMLAVTKELANALVDVTQAALDSVEESMWQFEEAEERLRGRAGQVAYIAADLPRAMPHVWTNHNIAATIEYVATAGTNVTAYVWFTQEPAVEPVIGMEYSIRKGEWVWLKSITNSYPETVEINGVPCVAYEMAIEPEAAGIPLRPDYELGFGSPEKGLGVPGGGVVVTAEGANHFGFSGVDVYSENLSIAYSGGIAVGALYHGTNYTGVVQL